MGDTVQDDPPTSGEPTSDRELSAQRELAARRRENRRRQVARRQATFLALAAALVVFIAVLVIGAGSNSPGRATATSTGTHAAQGHAAVALTVAQRQALPVDKVLGYTSYVRLGSAAKREVALTFDDGPGPYTPKIIHVLERMHVPATFFAIGKWVRLYPQMIAAEAKAGDEVGDHTQDHPPLAELTPAAQMAEIDAAAQEIEEAGAPAPVLMRPPYGSFDDATLKVLEQQRLLMVLWSVDTEDYTRPGVQRIVHTALSDAQPGGIILMHDGGGDRSETIAALPKIIAGLHKRGYKLVTISQLVADDPPSATQPAPTPLSGASL